MVIESKSNRKLERVRIMNQGKGWGARGVLCKIEGGKVKRQMYSDRVTPFGSSTTMELEGPFRAFSSLLNKADITVRGGSARGLNAGGNGAEWGEKKGKIGKIIIGATSR